MLEIDTVDYTNRGSINKDIVQFKLLNKLIQRANNK